MTTIEDPIPANENQDPFLRADTALDELRRLRREVLTRDTDGYTFGKWRERQKVLKDLDEGISLCLSKL